MENFLICMFDFRLVGKGVLRGQPQENPVLGFPYDFVHYEPSKEVSLKIVGEMQYDLTMEEIAQVQSFIDSYPFIVWELAEDGTCLGEKLITEVTGAYAHCPPPKLEGHYWYNPQKQQWDYIYGVDENKKYIGNVPFIESTYFADCPANQSYEAWDDSIKKWVDPRSLSELKSDFMAEMRVLAERVKSYGVILNGHVWGSTPEDIVAIDNAPSDTASWRTSDGEDVDLGGTSLADIKVAILDYHRGVEDRFNAAQINVDAATTKEEVLGVIF